MKKRSGISLVEMLTVVAVMPVVVLISTKLFRVISYDIPRGYRIIEESATLDNMLGQMHEDIYAAKALPESFGKYKADKETLLIEQAERTICYKMEDRKMERRILTNDGQSSDEGAKEWQLPKSKIDWQVWRRDGRGYAVEIGTYIEQKVNGRAEKKMANSHLYFAGARAAGLEK